MKINKTYFDYKNIFFQHIKSKDFALITQIAVSASFALGAYLASYYRFDFMLTSALGTSSIVVGLGSTLVWTLQSLKKKERVMDLPVVNFENVRGGNSNQVSEEIKQERSNMSSSDDGKIQSSSYIIQDFPSKEQVFEEPASSSQPVKKESSRGSNVASLKSSLVRKFSTLKKDSVRFYRNTRREVDIAKSIREGNREDVKTYLHSRKMTVFGLFTSLKISDLLPFFHSAIINNQEEIAQIFLEEEPRLLFAKNENGKLIENVVSDDQRILLNKLANKVLEGNQLKLSELIKEAIDNGSSLFLTRYIFKKYPLDMQIAEGKTVRQYVESNAACKKTLEDLENARIDSRSSKGSPNLEDVD